MVTVLRVQVLVEAADGFSLVIVPPRFLIRRRYFAKGTDLLVRDQAHLDAFVGELNGRPRQTLPWLKPLEALAKVVASGNSSPTLT
jgi:hypothetical protein